MSYEKLSIDSLVSGNSSGSSSKGLCIENLSVNALNKAEPKISFTSNILVDRIKQRRKEKNNCYKQMLKYCYDRINEADKDQCTDLFFTVVDDVPECKEYVPKECINYISNILRDDDFDTVIISNTTIFITWINIEKNKNKEKF
jgi:hypothetical protein